MRGGSERVRRRRRVGGDRTRLPRGVSWGYWERRGERTQCTHVLAGLDGLEADEGDLHTGECPNNIPGGVTDVKLVVESAHQSENQGVQRDHVGDEHVSTPSGDHVEVEHAGEHAVERAAVLHGFDPEVEGEHEEEDGDGFVVVGAGDGAGDVAWCDADEDGGEETG